MLYRTKTPCTNLSVWHILEEALVDLSKVDLLSQMQIVVEYSRDNDNTVHWIQARVYTTEIDNCFIRISDGLQKQWYSNFF